MRRLIAITLSALAGVPLAAQEAAVRGPARPPVAQLRPDLQAILARPEYHQGNGEWLYNYLYRFWHAFQIWYNDHLARYFERLHDVSPFIYWAIVAVAAAAVGLLLYHLLLTLRGAFGTLPRSRGAGPNAPGESLLADPAALLAQADAAAAGGDFEQALRHLYLALIRNLDRHDLVRYDRSRTNYEYLRQVRGQEAVAGPLAALTAQAEAVWYGEQPVHQAYYQRCRDLALAAWQGEGAHAAT